MASEAYGSNRTFIHQSANCKGSIAGFQNSHPPQALSVSGKQCRGYPNRQNLTTINIFQTIARTIIKKSFHLSVWTIEQFHDIAVYEQQARKLQELPDGTLGKDIANCLEKNNLRLVPNYESHDLKHVLLDFKMTPVDEIRMQAFMLGNGNYSIPSFAIFIFGALLLPDLWTTFYKDYQNGLHSKPIKTWTIEDYAHCQTSTLRQIVTNYSFRQQREFNMKSLIRFGALTAIVLGTFGMLFCLPFLFSSNVADLVGAGFPFVGGAIIVSASCKNIIFSLLRLYYSIIILLFPSAYTI